MTRSLRNARDRLVQRGDPKPTIEAIKAEAANPGGKRQDTPQLSRKRKNRRKKKRGNGKRLDPKLLRWERQVPLEEAIA